MNTININQIGVSEQVTRNELFDNSGKIKRSYLPIAASFTPYKCTNASDTPKGVTWTKDDDTTITGTLEASASTTESIYFIPNAGEGYKQYITFRDGEEGSYTYSWDCIDEDSFDPTDIIDKISKLDSSVQALSNLEWKYI